MSSIISLRDVTLVRQGRTVLSVRELDIASGERVAVTGPNGSGKTSLLRVLGGLDHASSGSCSVAADRLERVYVQQSPYLLRGSVLFNVGYGLAARGMSKKERRKTALAHLESLGGAHLVEARVRTLSGGEVRRVALARALALEPKLLLLDEPLADLDASGQSQLLHTLAALKSTTLVIASPSEAPWRSFARIHQLT